MELQFTAESISKIISWRVKEGAFIKKGHVILEYAVDEGTGTGAGGNPPSAQVQRFKALEAGVVQGILASKGDTIVKGTPLLVLAPCLHPTVFNDMCGKCGADLAKLDTPTPGSTGASSYVSMIHSVPGLKVSLKDAKCLDKTEEDHLLQHRQLRLLVDLDQTLIHTTNDTVPLNLKDVFHFQLWGHGSIWYHTRLRPRTRIFLENISKLYQLHICTFGSRNYAHTIAKQLDPTGNFFYNRILSRDECFSQNSKTANLKELFPNGDHMVCIIDDREDVWNYGPNLIHVKPYHFFRHTGDINAPPGFAKKDEDDKTGFDFTNPDGAVNVNKGENNSLPSSQESSCSGPVSGKSDGDSSESQKSTDAGKSSGIKEVSKDLSLSDDDDSQDASATASMAEDKANDGDSESSSNDDEGTTESETDSAVKAQDASTNASTGESSEPSVVQEQNSESSSTASTPKAEEGTSQPQPTLEMEVENLEIEKSEPNDIVTNPSSSPEKENKKEDGELSDSSSFSQTGGEIVAPPADEIPIATQVQSKGDTLEVEDEDDYLLYLEDILKQIHEAFYRLYDDMKEKGKGQVPDVKNVIPYVRRKVLKGCSIVFSGVVPMDRKLEKSRPYAVAQSLGAQVSDKIIPPPKQGIPSTSTAAGKESQLIPTTHIVAARLGTAKVNEARRYKGVHVVTPNWLWCCAERWERVDEKLFALGKKSDVKRNPPAHCSSPDVSFCQSNEDYEMLTPLESFDSDADAVFSQSGMIKPKNGQTPAARRGRTPSGRFMDTINPLFSFSMDDIESMGQEVDDICNESDSSSSEEEEKEQVVRKKPTKKTSPAHTPNSGLNSISKSDNSSSSETSDEEKLEARRAAGLNPRKRRREPRNTETETEDEPLSARFRRGEALPSDCDMLNLTNPSSDDDDDNDDDAEANERMIRELEDELLGDEDESRDRDSS